MDTLKDFIQVLDIVALLVAFTILSIGNISEICSISNALIQDSM